MRTGLLARMPSDAANLTTRPRDGGHRESEEQG